MKDSERVKELVEVASPSRTIRPKRETGKEDSSWASYARKIGKGAGSSRRGKRKVKHERKRKK